MWLSLAAFLFHTAHPQPCTQPIDYVSRPSPHPFPFPAPAERPAAYRQALELADHFEVRGITADIEGGVLRIFFPYRRPPQPQLLRPQGPRRVVIQAPVSALAPAPAPVPAPPAAAAAPQLAQRCHRHHHQRHPRPQATQQLRHRSAEQVRILQVLPGAPCYCLALLHVYVPAWSCLCCPQF